MKEEAKTKKSTVKVNSIHIFTEHLRNDGKVISFAKIQIEGLGELEIKDCVARSTIETLCKQVEAFSMNRFLETEI